MKFALKAGIAALALVAAAPALALDPPVSPCDVLLTNPDASACAGYYSGNLINGSAEDRANQAAAIATLPGGAGVFDGSQAAWDALDPAWKIDAGPGVTPIDFGVDLFGLQIIGAHFGNVAGDAGNVSVFWLIDFGAGGGRLSLDDTQGWSNAVLYTPPGGAVPEPATWAMMLMGFGAAGYALRRRRKDRLPQVA